MAIEDDQRAKAVDDQYAIGASTLVSTTLSLYGKRISAYIGIMMVPVFYSFLFSTIMYLVFGPAMLLYIGYLGSEPVSFIYGTFLLLSEPIPPGVFGPYVAVGGILMLSHLMTFSPKILLWDESIFTSSRQLSSVSAAILPLLNCDTATSTRSSGPNIRYFWMKRCVCSGTHSRK